MPQHFYSELQSNFSDAPAPEIDNAEIVWYNYIVIKRKKEVIKMKTRHDYNITIDCRKDKIVCTVSAECMDEAIAKAQNAFNYTIYKLGGQLCVSAQRAD